MNKAIFLDKDGTLVKDVPYNVEPELVTFYPDVFQTLKTLKQYGYKLIIVSNQAGIARGKCTKDEVVTVMNYVQKVIKSKTGYDLDGWYFCPHHPDGTIADYTGECDCRKPESGMLIRAAKDFKVNLHESWMVGDILNDVEAGNRAGCKTILINNGNETEWVLTRYRTPKYIVKEFSEITKHILHHHKVFSYQA